MPGANVLRKALVSACPHARASSSGTLAHAASPPLHSMHQPTIPFSTCIPAAEAAANGGGPCLSHHLQSLPTATDANDASSRFLPRAKHEPVNVSKQGCASATSTAIRHQQPRSSFTVAAADCLVSTLLLVLRITSHPGPANTQLAWPGIGQVNLQGMALSTRPAQLSTRIPYTETSPHVRFTLPVSPQQWVAMDGPDKTEQAYLTSVLRVFLLSYDYQPYKAASWPSVHLLSRQQHAKWVRALRPLHEATGGP